MAKRPDSIRLTACPKVVNFRQNVISTFKVIILRAIDEDLFYKSTFLICHQDRGRTGGRSSASAQKNFTL